MSAVNWLGCHKLEITAAEYEGAPLVRLVQSVDSMHFQFDMSPEGARAMAAELIAKADEAEAVVAREQAA